jgi:tetratricopeptide (TPR) repeat protein
MAYLHYVKGDYQSAAEHLRQSFDLDRDYPEARLYEGLLHFQQQRYDAVIQCLSSSDAPLDIGLRAAALAKQGSLARAKECIERLHQLAGRQYVTPLAEGFAAIGMGDLDMAFQRLDEAINHKTSFLNLLAVEPFFHPLRADRRFATPFWPSVPPGTELHERTQDVMLSMMRFCTVVSLTYLLFREHRIEKRMWELMLRSAEGRFPNPLFMREWEHLIVELEPFPEFVALVTSAHRMPAVCEPASPA